MLKLNDLDPKLRERIQKQIQTEDAGKPVARLRAKVSQPDQRSEGKDRSFIPRQEGVHYCIAITVFRRRLLDNHDNARSACKKLCDLITLCLGFKSDDCPELYWEYHQCKTRGACGTQIIISQI